MTPAEQTGYRHSKLDDIHEDVKHLQCLVSDVRVEVAENRQLSKLGHHRIELLEERYHQDIKKRIAWVFGVGGSVIATIAATVLLKFAL